jgi:hypothetical protein
MSDDNTTPLTEDNSTPASPPSGPDDLGVINENPETEAADDTHPKTDSNVDQQEVYDEGLVDSEGIDPNVPADENPEATDHV